MARFYEAPRIGTILLRAAPWIDMSDNDRMWLSVPRASVGVLSLLNTTMTKLELAQGDFPDLRNGSALLIASDYSGHHAGVLYEAYSFVVTTIEAWKEWEVDRVKIRKKFSLTRRMAFKNLDDAKRWEVLPWFVAAASNLTGITVTILVHKSTPSLFSSTGVLDRQRPELQPFAGWKRGPVERMLRIVHFVALLIVGVARSDQPVMWFTDQDDIVANPDRLDLVRTAVSNASSHLADGNSPPVLVGTTAADSGNLDLEDLAAIADLSAGAAVEVISGETEAGKTTNELIATPIEPVSRKTFKLLYWLGVRDMPHKHVVIAIEPGPLKGQIQSRRLKFDSIERPKML